MDFREGVLVRPLERLSPGEQDRIHQASMQVLMDPGLLVFHPGAAGIFREAGARVSPARGTDSGGWQVALPEALVKKALETAPKEVILGARSPGNALILEGSRPRVYFGSGSETNFTLETVLDTYIKEGDPETRATLPVYQKKRGSLAGLCRAAHLGENLENLDFFIRPVNIQDPDITQENKDVNKFFACLDNMTKHVMAGITDIGQLDQVIRMAEIVAGGREALEKNPVISFISCVTKSPLQLTEEATAIMLAVNQRGMPLVISSSPQGGSTAPIEEAGMVSQINAEILGGVTLSQLACPGSPVIYGSVPVRARMDNLHDMYGAPEFNQYNVSCVQMARYYGLPCYSTGGVSDARTPGIQASIEKMFSHLFVSQGGPHLLHYAFGLLEETQTFCPEQAVLDNAHIGMVKKVFRQPDITQEKLDSNLEVIRKVMKSSHRLFARYARKQLHSGQLYLSYPFESQAEDRDETMVMAAREKERILELPPRKLPPETREKVFQEIPGILDKLKDPAFPQG